MSPFVVLRALRAFVFNVVGEGEPMKHNITIITGTRAEFGILTPILHALQKSKSLHPQLLVTGMHLQEQFGYTLNDIKKSGIPIAATAEMYKSRDTPADSLSRATKTIAQALTQLKPSLVLLLGDRLEMLAAANAALALQLPIAHLHGGETAPGQWDEQIRHALTKLAHLHIPATQKSRPKESNKWANPKTHHPHHWCPRVRYHPTLETPIIASHPGFSLPLAHTSGPGACLMCLLKHLASLSPRCLQPDLPRSNLKNIAPQCCSKPSENIPTPSSAPTTIPATKAS